MSRVSKVRGMTATVLIKDDLPWEEQTSMTQPRPEGGLLVVDPVSPLEPWEQCPTVWKTKPAFFQWMRGQMRRAWSRHPVKVSYMHNHRERVPLGRKTEKNPTGLVWGCRCEHCNNLFKQVECEVDHIEAAGSFKGWEDFEAWMMKLMHINWDSIRVVCKECHRIISYAERMGYTFEEAKLEKEVIKFTKLSANKQWAALKCSHAGINNAKQRRAAYKQYLQEKLHDES